MVHKLLVVTFEVMVDHIIEVGLVLDLHLLTEMLQQGCQYLTIGIIVPLAGVVLELDIVRLGVSFLTVDDGAILHTDSTTGHLVSRASEGLVIEGQSPHRSKTLLIEMLQQLEVKLTHKETRRVLIVADLLLVFGLLTDKTDGVYTLVHADTVLPVVRTLGVLGVVLDAHSLISPHMTQHHCLLHLTGLIHRFVSGITTLKDTITRQITARTARIADSHRERTWLIALK